MKTILSIRINLVFMSTMLSLFFMAPATQGFELTLADFEQGVDKRGSIGWNPNALQVGGPWYAWENPPTPNGDDINYWDIYSNKNNIDSPVDYELNFPVQDWRHSTNLVIKYFAWRDDGSDATSDSDTSNVKIRVYVYDADGTGNSDGNGFQLLGDHSGGGTVAFPLTGMNNRDQVVKIKIRIFESFFGGVASNSKWGRQRTHLQKISLLTDRVKIISDTSNSLSTYSPFVMHQPGWDRYRMYFGRNETLNNNTRDRIYLAENFGDGVTGWGSPILVLSPDATSTVGERGLIHDPAVVVIGASWHMYYTGTDDMIGMKNAIFHAISSDGVKWQKRGRVAITGITLSELQAGNWGYGDSSILYENNQFRLYFFSDKCWCGTVYLAEGSDGHTFTYRGPVTNKNLMHPEIRKNGSIYSLVGSTSFKNIYRIDSANPTWFPQTAERLLFTIGPSWSWDSYEIGTPSILPGESRVYYGGTSYVGSSQPMEEGSIGVKGIP